ncbi:non-homologous end-joining DNA ligase [Brevibacillus fluminis]|nr:non-homologous end-joining DNA ligase [Brevibacillus fluminis]
MGVGVADRHEIQVEGKTVLITHPEKELWAKKGIRKIDYLHYLSMIAPHMLPFLAERALTVIRFPDGVGGKKSFYQKNVPQQAPKFVCTTSHDGNEHVVCGDLPTLLWLGNQAAVEFHIPFNRIDDQGPAEIVFDLDPPSREEFVMAVEAALILKEMFDRLGLISFVKTSGNKGLQLYIPLAAGTFSYEETRRFTQFFANYLVAREPDWFTIERFKASRGNRLYVDYVQHARGKTVISPYSLRGNEEALLAAPLFWHEVTRSLRPTQFPLETIKERLATVGCPFADFMDAKKKQPLGPVMKWIAAQG